MSSYLTFPSKKDDLAEALGEVVNRSLVERNLASIEWYIAHYYLQGVRHFEIVDWREGHVRIPYENQKGELEFTYEALLYQYRVELGRLMRMNVEPAVGRDGFGLDSVRNSGMAHAILSYMDGNGGKISSRKNLSRLAQVLLKYGTGGISHYRCPGDDVGKRTCGEIVAPWELLCIPGEIDTLDEQRGLVRHRDLPLEWVETLGLDLGKDYDKLEVQELPYGVSPMSQSPQDRRGGQTGDASYGSGSKIDEQNRSNYSKSQKRMKGSPRKGMQRWVKMDEVQLLGEKDKVYRYVVKVGRVIGRDVTFQRPVACPLSVCRYISTGRFYGRGFVGSQLGLNYENEKMLSNTFQNVSDADAYPITVIPTTSGITRAQMEKPERRKFLFAEPDPVTPDQKVYTVAPHNSGDYPAKVAALGVELQDKWAGQSELYSGGSPGRVDSASALGFLFETGNVNLVATVNEVADAYVQVYESMLDAAHAEWKMAKAGERGSNVTFKIPVIDDRIIGVAMDASSGAIKLADNPVPLPEDVKIDVGERMLRSREQTKQEAAAMLTAGILTQQQFKILNEKEGWGFPVLDRSDWEAYRKAQVLKIVLFNDGVTPGELVGGTEYDRPDIILEVFQELMGSVEFMVASPGVKNAFIQTKQQYEGMIGGFPDQLGLPGEEAGAPGPTGQGGALPPGGPGDMAMGGGGGAMAPPGGL